MIRLCKVALVAIIATFFTFVVFNNTSDYFSNYVFVQHVLSMDSIRSNLPTAWRSIESPTLQTLFYCGIICWEAASAIVCWIAAIKLFQARHSTIAFNQQKSIAVLGLTIAFALYAFGFMTVAGEWFQMYLSPHWNGQGAAGMFLNMIGLTLVIVLSADE